MPNGANNGARRLSTAGPRAQAACAHACEAHKRVADLARTVAEDLDQVTQPGVPVEISEEDSIVTTLEAAIKEHAQQR